MTRALFIVDVQNDFSEGGALGVVGGTRIASAVSRLLSERGDEYACVFASRDWHDADSDNGGHFATDADPDFRLTWPVHCVAGTAGAEYHPALTMDAVDFHIRKGRGEPAYSIFEGATDDGESTIDVLTRLGVTEMDIAGLATDYCVRASALDALGHGKQVRILTDLVAGVAAESSAAALAEIERAGGILTTAQ